MELICEMIAKEAETRRTFECRVDPGYCVVLRRRTYFDWWRNNHMCSLSCAIHLKPYRTSIHHNPEPDGIIRVTGFVEHIFTPMSAWQTQYAMCSPDFRIAPMIDDIEMRFIGRTRFTLRRIARRVMGYVRNHSE